MTEYRVAAITDWSDFNKTERRSSPFTAAWTSTEQLLDGEVGWLQNGHTRFFGEFTIELDARPGDFRRDGGLRADARPSSPAVRVTFDTPEHGRLSYPCDTFLTWQDNVRAIALGLEALRKFDRYGVGSGQQYHGYAQLPPGPSAAIVLPPSMTPQEAEAVISGVLGAFDRSEGRKRLQRARGLAHPDNSGDRDLWDKVEQASRVLGYE